VKAANSGLRDSVNLLSAAEGEIDMAFARFMAQPFGRVARIIAGLVIMEVGYTVVGGTVGWIVTAVGLIPLLAGVFNVCLIAPLIHAPFSGKDARHRA
jgi:hypothetical protein